MHCKEEELVLKAHGRLHGLAAWRTHRHLSHCAHCQQELKRLETLGAALRELSARTPSMALDTRVQSIRPPTEHTRRLPLLRIPAPIIGAVFGLLFGGVQLQGRHDYAVSAQTALTLTQAPPEFTSIAPALVRSHFLVKSWQEGEGQVRGIGFRTTEADSRGRGTIQLEVHGLDEQRARAKLDDWIATLERSQTDKRFLSTARLGKIQHQHSPVTVTTDPFSYQSTARWRWEQLLWYLLAGFLIGGAFSLLRLIGPWIPGGLVGCLVLGGFLGMGLAYVAGGRLQTQYSAQATLVFTHTDGTAIQHFQEHALLSRLVMEHSEVLPPSPSNVLVQSEIEREQPQGTFVLCSRSSDRAVAEQTMQRWLAETRQFIGWKALGYQVRVAEKIEMSSEPIKDKLNFWAGLAGGLVLGMIMSFSRKKQ